MIINTNRQLRFVLVGCGRIAQAHLEAVTSNPNCLLVAVADSRENAAQSMAAQYNHECRAYTDYREMLCKEDIHCAILCTPPDTHAEIACDFLSNHNDVLCEKPFAIHSGDARRMVRLAEENQCLVMMASKFRYVKDIIKAKAIIDSGILGDIVLFEVTFCSKVDMRNRWNSVREKSGGGVLIDNGTHAIDIARFLLGPLSYVQAIEGKRVQQLDIEDTARLYFKTECGAMGAVDLSWSIHKDLDSYVNIFGTDGMLSIGWKVSKYRQNEKTNWVPFGSGYDKQSAFAGQIKNFVDSINGVDRPLITPDAGLESVKVVEAAYRSAAMNQWVKVE